MKAVAQDICTGCRTQRGVAAIEFALVIMVLFLVLYALLTFGAALYTQQVVSRAAEDGARAATLLPRPPDPVKVKQAVVESLARSLIVPASANGNLTSRKNWISAHITIESCPVAPSTPTCVVTVTYPYETDARFLPQMPLFDASNWIKQLQGKATAALATS
ncbi:pilus assembly protein [Variovorax sp. KBS0712]|uniref:TadE/TadG family type IV pilus assembly protein n=1 Tax=Variovorax sp. KBS0712 TaxID=2578111 RepID=UPI00111AA5E5|nr:TadE family protein [Variovorax sp. KBS0712]TSD56572.1 pilus assembly protein [Variovorax sp. KBS0712]